MEWEHMQEGLRLASRAPVPWDNSNVAMICVTRGGQIRAVHTNTGKREMLEGATPEDMLLVACPAPGGKTCSLSMTEGRRCRH
jgi:hypothetical protein